MKDLDLGKNENSSKGITLVALVITIIVLLILATVSIQTLTGSNGLLTKTETAVQSNKDSQEEEKVKLAVAAAQMAGEGTIITDNLNNELQKNFNDDNVVESISIGWIYKAQKSYTIYKDGKVEQGEKYLPDGYTQLKYIESTGSQYIDTGLLAKNYSDIICEIKGSYTKIVSSRTIFGAGGGNSNTWYLIGILYGTSDFGAQKGIGETEKKFCNADLNEHVFTLDLRYWNCLS